MTAASGGASSGSTSWQEFLDNTLIRHGFTSCAAIFGIEKAQKWASSKGFEITAPNIKNLIKGFVDPADLRTGGIVLSSDRKYSCVRADMDMIMGRSHSGGCVLSKCRKCVIVAVFEDVHLANGCLFIVARLSNYLINLGY